MLALVERLNISGAHDGILVQSPLPKALGPDAAARVFDAIAPEKDVDGFTPVNVGRLVQGRPALVACTPLGIIELLTRKASPIAGRRACVIGRSDIVGKPMALLLLQRDATVTICHSKTPDLAAVCREADILVAAVGRAGLVTREFVKPGATVIDVGMNRVTDPASPPDCIPTGIRGSRDSVARLAARRRRPPRSDRDRRCHHACPRRRWTLTVTMLMMNTLRAAARATWSGAEGVRRIGLTGGIATGKSHVRAHFESWASQPSIPTALHARRWRRDQPA